MHTRDIVDVTRGGGVLEVGLPGREANDLLAEGRVCLKEWG